MKILIDAHLPVSICDFFIDCDCIHTNHLKNGNLTKDTFINELSIQEKRAVITKDSDFYYSYIASEKPNEAPNSNKTNSKKATSSQAPNFNKREWLVR